MCSVWLSDDILYLIRKCSKITGFMSLHIISINPHIQKLMVLFLININHIYIRFWTRDRSFKHLQEMSIIPLKLSTRNPYVKTKHRQPIRYN